MTNKPALTKKTHTHSHRKQSRHSFACKNYSHECAYDWGNFLVHNTAHNLLSYPPDNHQSSDVVYSTKGRGNQYTDDWLLGFNRYTLNHVYNLDLTIHCRQEVKLLGVVRCELTNNE